MKYITLFFFIFYTSFANTTIPFTVKCAVLKKTSSIIIKSENDFHKIQLINPHSNDEIYLIKSDEDIKIIDLKPYKKLLITIKSSKIEALRVFNIKNKKLKPIYAFQDFD
ncbi:MAG: hypothetical protein ACRC1R_05015 [Cetobacterium sp.]|uniref:hypothetical protein n=1 Tax=Cetobacterium sp. TaxID=2071632 RepID=UPI003F37D7BF